MSIISQIGVVILIAFIVLVLIRSNKNLKKASEEGENFVDEWALRQEKKEEIKQKREEKKLEVQKEKEKAEKKVEEKDQEIKQMIQVMLANGMSLEFVSKSLSKSEDEIMELLK